MADKTIILSKDPSQLCQEIPLIEGDNNTYVIRFVAPRYSGGVDLANLTWGVNIKNATLEQGFVNLSLATSDDSAVYIDWNVGSFATVLHGSSFCTIEGRNNSNSAHPVWKSSVVTLRVGRAISADDIIDGSDIDSITEIAENVAESIVNNSVRYDTSQSLNSTQKTTARTNIGAVSQDEVQQAVATETSAREAAVAAEATAREAADNEIYDVISNVIKTIDLDNYSTTEIGKYVTINGSVASDSNYNYTVVDMNKGDRLVADIFGSVSVATLSLAYENNFQLLERGIGAFNKYEYIAQRNCSVAISYRAGSTPHSAYIVIGSELDNLSMVDDIETINYSANKKSYFSRANRMTFDDSNQKRVQPKMLGSTVWAWNQLNANSRNTQTNNVTFTNNGDGTWTITGNKVVGQAIVAIDYQSGRYIFTEGHWYLFSTGNDNVSFYGYRYDTTHPVGLTQKTNRQLAKAPEQNGAYDVLYLRVPNDYEGNINVTVRPICVDLTLLYGAGNEPTQDDDDIFATIEQHANAFGGYVEKQLIEGGVTSVNGNNIFSIPSLIRSLDGYTFATYNSYNYLSYDTWTENQVLKQGWRFHKRVGKIILDGTQEIKTVAFNNTETTSAWIYEYIGQKYHDDIHTADDLLSDNLVARAFVDINNDDVSVGSIAGYNNTAYGFVVRVPVAGITTKSQINEYMANNPSVVYYLLSNEVVVDVSEHMSVITLLCNNAYYVNTGSSRIVGVPSRFDVFENGDRDQPPLMTIIDDDGDVHFLTDVVPLIERLKVPIASAVTVRNIGNGRFMSYAQIDECNDSGAEILCHTLDHPSYVTDVDEKLEEHKYRRAMNTLLRHGYHSCDILVYTSSTGEYKSFQRAAEKVFKCGIKIGGSKINYTDANIFALARYRIDYAVTEGRSDWNYDDMTSWVDECARNGGWLILMFHTSNDIYRQRVETDSSGNVIYVDGKPVPMTDGGQPVIDTDGTYPTMGSTVYLPMLENLINYAATNGIETVTAEYGFNTYYGYKA